jgi:ATP-dependent helicase IRC3
LRLKKRKQEAFLSDLRGYIEAPNKSLGEWKRMRFELRDYQKEAIHASLSARSSGIRRMLICLPTGSGKTVIFSELCRMEEGKVLILAHREELLTQAHDKVRRAVGRTKRVSIEQGENQADPESDIVVASIRTLHPERLDGLLKKHRFDLVVYDECHHAAAEDNKRVLRQLGCFNKGWKGTLVGFTATTTRADGIGLDSVFERIVYEHGLLEMVSAGHLVPLRGYRICTARELEDSMGWEDLPEAVDIETRNALVARAIQELARDRRTIVFCASVAHAMNMAHALNALGLPSGVVYGDMPSEKRTETLRLFRDGHLAAVTNVGVLTEGFDDPGVSCIAMARPTKSVSLYTQCVGRGTRTAEGKRDCIVLDFVDLSALSLVTLPSLLGLPVDLDMEGELSTEVVRQYRRIRFDYPSFHCEAAGITLREIKRRAESFDPLTLAIDPEVMAITENGWYSLGSRGLSLYFFRSQGRISRAEILDSSSKGKKYRVLMDGKEAAFFSRITEAVEAVDYEIEMMGEIEASTAREGAPWRLEPVPGPLLQTLASLKPPRHAESIGDALGHLAYDEHNGKRQQTAGRGSGWPALWDERA